MIFHHVLSLAINPEPRREQGHKTIVQPLLPFHGKQDFSISQTAFEYLTWPNQTSLHHVAVIQPSGAEKRAQSILQEHIQRSKLPSCLHQLRSLQRWMTLEWKCAFVRRNEERSLTATGGSLRTSNGPVFAGKPNVISRKLWHPPWWEQVLSAL